MFRSWAGTLLQDDITKDKMIKEKKPAAAKGGAAGRAGSAGGKGKGRAK